MSEEGKKAALAIAEQNMARIQELEDALRYLLGEAPYTVEYSRAAQNADEVLAKAGPR